MMRAFYLFLLPIFSLLLSGCHTDRAPTIALFGAYFPSWILCFTLSIILTLILRAVFILLHWDDWIEYKVLFYVAFVFIFAFTLTFTLFY